MNRALYPVQVASSAFKLIPIGFTALGSATPTTKANGAYFSVAHTATGVWTVTMTDQYYQLLTWTSEVQDATTTPLCSKVTLSEFTNEASTSNVTFKVNIFTDDATSGVPTLTDVTGVRVAINLFVHDSAQTP